MTRHSTLDSNRRQPTHCGSSQPLLVNVCLPATSSFIVATAGNPNIDKHTKKKPNSLNLRIVLTLD
jgi:hypothetical protein